MPTLQWGSTKKSALLARTIHHVVIKWTTTFKIQTTDPCLHKPQQSVGKPWKAVTCCTTGTEMLHLVSHSSHVIGCIIYLTMGTARLIIICSTIGSERLFHMSDMHWEVVLHAPLQALWDCNMSPNRDWEAVLPALQQALRGYITSSTRGTLRLCHMSHTAPWEAVLYVPQQALWGCITCPLTGTERLYHISYNKEAVIHITQQALRECFTCCLTVPAVGYHMSDSRHRKAVLHVPQHILRGAIATPITGTETISHVPQQVLGSCVRCHTGTERLYHMFHDRETVSHVTQ